MWVHRDVGQYVASEASTVVAGRSYKPSAKRPIIWFGGLGTDREFLDATASGNQIAPGIVEGGAPIIQAEFGGPNQWGNDTSQTRIGQAWTYVKTLTSCKTDKMILVGLSKGVLACLNYARANPSNVAAIVGIIPAVNLTNVYADTDASGKSAIDTAYTDHAGYLSALATHDPALNAATHASQGLPMKLIYGTADLVVRPADAVSFAATVGASTKSITGTDHTTTCPAVVPYDDVFTFIRPYLS